MMIGKTLLAASVATGLIVPAKAELYVPSAAALIKSLKELPADPLLGMPLTMGMLPGRGGTTPVTELTRPTTSSGASTSVATTYTFNSIAFGTASSTRRVFALVTGRSGSTGRTISSGTIGGVSATIHVQNTASSGGSTVTGILSADVPAGTTGTVAITFSASMDGGCVVFVIALDNLQSTTPVDTGGATAVSGASVSDTSVAWNAGGYVMAVAHFHSGTGNTTWTGLTESADVSSNSSPHTFAYLQPTTSATGQTVTATSSASRSRLSLSIVSMR